MSNLKTASVLAFERNFDISDGVFRQKTGKGELIPVEVTEKSIRGTISNRLKATITRDPAKLDAEVEKANLQRVDVAMLNHDADTLLVNWSLKVLPFTGKPCVCNNQAYQTRVLEVVKNYLDQYGVAELARRYALNVVNARWLWRNRIGAESIKITVTHNKQSIVFEDAKKYSLNNFDSHDDNVMKLAKIIERGLTTEGEYILLNIEAEAVIGEGQEAYPSQELILDTGNEKSKVLYSVGGYAAMHSQKIGNAIRTIDNWYEAAEFPIAIEPYGSVTTLGTAFRQPRQKQDFYSLFDNWVLKDEVPSVEQQHYVIGILIRGGVFGESGKE